MKTFAQRIAALLIAFALSATAATALAVGLSLAAPAPVAAAAPGCPSTNTPQLTGDLTDSAGTLVSSVNATSPALYGEITSVERAWGTCLTKWTYDGVIIRDHSATPQYYGTWGLLINSDTLICNWTVGSGNDWLRANTTTTCLAGSSTSYRLRISLPDDGVFTNNAALTTNGQFAFSHSGCSVSYGASVSEPTGSPANPGTSSAIKPGANCDAQVVDGTGVAQSITRDTVAPTVSSFTAPATPTNATSLAYPLTFSESVSGLAATDFAITGTATGWSAAVSGSGAAYTVTLTGGTAGTVILALNASTVSDAVGNPGPASANAAPIVTVDRTAATVSSFTAPATPTNATSLAYPLTFSESVSGLAATDFAITGTATGWSVTGITGSGAGPYSVTLGNGTAGTVVLTLNASTVSDTAGNSSPLSASTAPTVTVDRTAPTVSAFTAPATPTNATSLAYPLTFSESVSGLAATDFAITGTAIGWSAAVAGSGAAYTVTLSGGTAGTVILTLNANTVTDGANNGPASAVAAPTVTVDRTAPTVSAFTAPATPTNATSLAYGLTFSESVSGLAAGDFTIGGTAIGWSAAVAGSGAAYTVTLSGGGEGTVILTLTANTVTDGANNGPASASTAPSVTVDRTAPTVSSFTAPATPTNATSLAYSLTFSESVSGLAATDFAITGTASTWSVTGITGSGSGPYIVTLTGGTAGTVILTLNASMVSDTAGSSGPTSANAAPTVTVDRTAPTTTFSWPPAGTSTSAINPVAAWTETETGSGVASRSLQREVTTVPSPGTCGTTWTADGSPTTGASPVAQTTSSGSCYRWTLTLTDLAGNSSSTTSGSLIRDTTSGLGQLPFQRSETFGLGAGDELAVNVASGNALISHPIVNLPIRGSTLALGLTYNSQDAGDIGVGPGWRLNVQRRLTQNADGTVTLIDATGARHAFTSPVTVGSATTWTRPASIYATLARDASLSPARFTLTYRDQARDIFEVLGSEALLVREADRFGNGVDLAYTAGTTRIATITDPAGRTVSFTWNGADHLASITDWAWIDAAGVVQTSASGSQRTYRFFYDANTLVGWSDPLNTSGSCPTGGSHLVCLTYASGKVSTISRTLTTTTLGASTLGTASTTSTTTIAYAGSDVSSVQGPEQAPATATSFTRLSPTTTAVVRHGTPDATTTYGFVGAADAYLRVQSVWRTDAEHGVQIEQRTTYDTTYPTEPATVTDNDGALLGTPARTTSTTYVANSVGLVAKVVEPLTGSTNRWTESTYTANNDVLTRTVSLDGANPVVTKSCYSADCTTNTGLTLLRRIEHYVAAGPQDADTNVTTDTAYDPYGRRTLETRHNRDAAGSVRDDRATGSVYDTANLGNLVATIANVADGSVSSPGSDVTPDAAGVRTDLTTAYGYDTAGNEVSVADPRRAILAATGSPAADDYVTRLTFDALNEQLTEQTPATPGLATVRTSSQVYDELGNVRQATDFGGVVTGTEHDRAGRATRTFEDTDAAGPLAPAVTSTTTTDAAGRVVAAYDRTQSAPGSTRGYTKTVHDSLGRAIATYEAYGTPDQAQTASTFDALDRQASLEVGVGAAASQRTTSTYDLGGRTIATDDGFTCRASSFDVRDLVATSVDALDPGTCAANTGSRTVTSTYDGLGRLTRAEVTAGPGTGGRTTDGGPSLHHRPPEGQLPSGGHLVASGQIIAPACRPVSPSPFSAAITGGFMPIQGCRQQTQRQARDRAVGATRDVPQRQPAARWGVHTSSTPTARVSPSGGWIRMAGSGTSGARGTRSGPLDSGTLVYGELSVATVESRSIQSTRTERIPTRLPTSMSVRASGCRGSPTRLHDENGPWVGVPKREPTVVYGAKGGSANCGGVKVSGGAHLPSRPSPP